MQRRYFLQSMGALLGIAAAPKLATAVTAPYPRSARELLAAGYQVEAVVLSLVDTYFHLIGLPRNRADLGCVHHTKDIPPAERIATVNAVGVTLNSTKTYAAASHGRIVEISSEVWLDCEDATFFNVSGGYSVGLMVALRFTNGAEPIVGFLTNSTCFNGLPVTLNGGNLHVQMPSEGLLRIA